jgi:hypothetical protein
MDMYLRDVPRFADEAFVEHRLVAGIIERATGTGSRCTLGHSNRAAAREASEGDLIDFVPRKTSIEARRLAQEYDVFVRDWGFAIQFVLCATTG